MEQARGRDTIVVGGLLALLGVLALLEGRRLYHLRETLVAGAVVGDDTLPILVGAALVVLGAYSALARPPAAKVTLPAGPVRARMLAAGVVLAVYWFLVPWLGYTASTALAGAALYRAMGGYRWPAAVAFAVLTTGLLYLLFRVWLLQPLPLGLLGA